jgi:hypothetical protein
LQSPLLIIARLECCGNIAAGDAGTLENRGERAAIGEALRGPIGNHLFELRRGQAPPPILVPRARHQCR